MAQPRFELEAIGDMLINDVDVDVDMLTESNISSSTIGTTGLGPCLCLLIQFNYYNPETNITMKKCMLEHYSFLINEKNNHQKKFFNKF